MTSKVFKKEQSLIAVKRLIVISLLITLFSGFIIKINLDSVDAVSSNTGKLINTHINELEKISDIQDLKKKLVINLHQYYANIDEKFYEENQKHINTIKDFILNNELIFDEPVKQQLLQNIMGFEQHSVNFHNEMLAGNQRDWEKLRQHLYSSQDNSKKIFLLLKDAGDDIREAIDTNSSSTLSGLRFLNNFQLIFIFALTILLLYVIYSLYIRIKDEDKLYTLAYYDKVTGLPNKLKFTLDTEPLFFSNTNKNNFILLLVNIDRFRLLTGRYGYQIGEKLIGKLSIMLEDKLNKQGNEFDIYKYTTTSWIVFLPNSIGVKAATNVADKMLTINSENIIVDEIQLTCSFSIGISFYEHQKKQIDLIREAESALYQSMENGGNCFQIYSEQMGNEIQEFVDTDNALRHALENKELQLYYQPKIDALTGKINSSEVLLRWISNDKFIPPNVFIPIAEKSGLITQIGNWVLFEACRQWVKRKELGLAQFPVAVNISAIQFQDSEFPSLVKTILNDTEIPASMLELEITEEAAATVPEKVISIMQELKNLGVRLAIDDFGTGYSSLSYLRRFPLDVLKIDQTFIRNLHTSDSDKSIVRLILDLAKNMSFKVVAEGVEYEEHYKKLREWGAEYMQGYYFYKPMPEHEFNELLEQEFHRDAA